MRTQGSVRKLGNKWWIRYCRGGRRFEENSQSTERGVAVRLLKIRTGEIAKGMPVNGHRVTVADAITTVINNYRKKEQRSIRSVEDRGERLREFFGKATMMASITADRIDAYVIERKDEGAANASVNRELALIKRMYTLAIKDGKLFARPRIEMLPEDNARQGYFEPEQFDAVRRNLPEHLRPLATFSYLTGWRKSEVHTRQWRHVDFDAETITLEPGETKNRKPRTISFAEWPELRQLLKDQRALTERLERERDAIIPWVFHRNGRPIVNYYGAWKTACVAAGCPGKIPHDFRRTAVRNLVRAGVPESIAMKITGHKTRSVFDRYDITSEEDKREAGRLVSVHLAAESGKIRGKSA
jgi:integrase